MCTTHHLPDVPPHHSLGLIHLFLHTLSDLLLEQLKPLASFSHTHVNESTHNAGLRLGGVEKRSKKIHLSSERLQYDHRLSNLRVG